LYWRLEHYYPASVFPPLNLHSFAF
jgi:hypothetical protein